MTRVKFCGLRSTSQVELAADLDVDFVGFVALAPHSHRNLELDLAAELVAEAPVEVETVLVTPSTDVEAVVEAVEAVRPHVVQLTGQIESSFADRVRRAHPVQLWRAFRPGLDPGRDLERLEALADHADAVVLDAMGSDGYGGSGDVLEWDHVRSLVEDLAGFPVVLAGGLDEENVVEAIRWVRPWCVDVSSGLETNGEKDPDRMRAFAAAVEEAR